MTDKENTPVEAAVATETPAVAAVAEAPAATEVAAVSEAPATTADAPVVNKDEEKAKILKQVEFYFSDSNLPVDKFLSELVNKSKDGYVSIAKIASFKRMRDFKDNALIVEALRESKSLLEVSEDGLKVRRKVPVGPIDDYHNRSIYAKGFGEETPSLQLELEQYFGALGDVKQVRMRRKNGSNEFKGSVFVEYATLDEANKVGSSKLQFNGQDLLVMTKNEYCEMKAKQLGLDPNEIKKSQMSKGFGNEKKRPREEDTVEDLKGKVIRLSGITTGEGAGLREIKDAMKEHFRYGYVFWPKETSVIEVQIKDADKDAAKVVADLQAKNFEFNGIKPEITVVSDEDTQKFFDEKK
ncbi:hypothetical protein BG015_004994, partial [Linnemannia schmuckeri]